MPLISQLLIYGASFFLLLGALDRVLKQLGKESMARPLKALAEFVDGAGAQFEAGVNSMGSLTLSMIGIIAFAPVLSRIVAPMVVPLFHLLGLSPSMFGTYFIACDMGGYNLAQKLAVAGGHVDYAGWLFAALIQGSMLGATIAFSIPVGLGLIKPADRRYFSLGVLLGMVTIPIGCLAGGIVARFSHIVATDGAVVNFSIAQMCKDLLPTTVVCSLVAIGLWKCPSALQRLFTIFARAIVVVTTICLAIALTQFLTGITLIAGIDPIFAVKGDTPGVDIRAFETVCRITVFLMGAYPMAYLLSRWCERPLSKLAKNLQLDQSSIVGMFATLANNIAMFSMLERMDARGKILNVAFSVSAAFLIGDHLAFTAATQPSMIVPMVAGKLVGGVTAVLFALWLLRRKPSLTGAS